jgi:hypothetical protein
MDSLILLAAIAAVPALIGIIFRVSAVYLFAAVTAGNLLIMYWGDDAGLAVGMMMKGANSNQIAQFILLFLPVVLVLLLLRKTLPKSKFLLQVPVLVGIGLTLAVLALPLLDSGAQAKIFDNEYGSLLRESQDVVVGATAISVVLLMLLTNRHKEDKKHKKKH